MKNRPTSTKAKSKFLNCNIPSNIKIAPKQTQGKECGFISYFEHKVARLILSNEEMPQEIVSECNEGRYLSLLFAENRRPTVELLHRQVGRLKTEIDKLEEQHKNEADSGK